MRLINISTVIVALIVAVAAPAIAAKGGNGNGNGNGNGGGDPGPSSTTDSCTVSGNDVTATGLPTDEVINFMVTDSSGTDGWVLGYTPDGTWWVPVATPTGPTTYEFVSRTYGPHGSKYAVFASCSV